MNIKTVRTPKELLNPEYADWPYDFANFIQVETMGQRSDAKKKLKLLKIIHPTVLHLLQPGERVFYVTQGLRVNNMEQFFIGWITYYFNLTAFVFTSQRILVIHLKSSSTRGTYLGCIEYADIKSVKSSFTGNFTVKYTNGKSMLFTKIPKRDRKYIQDLLNSVVMQGARIDRSAPSIRNLCPQCFSEVHKIPECCPSCQVPFKSPKKAALLSGLMPGLGDIYLGSRVLGTFELIFMVFLWVSVIFGLIEDVHNGREMTEGIVGVIIVFGIIHATDALKSHYLAQKGLIPTRVIRYAGE